MSGFKTSKSRISDERCVFALFKYLLVSHPLSARVVVLQAVGTLVFANVNTDLLVGGQSFSQPAWIPWAVFVIGKH